MSGVALRCATCGTTQSHPGECEACFEGSVRYFCGNHTPGLWLDEPACHACGAKFGDPPKRPAARRTPAASEGPARTMRGPRSRSPRTPGGEPAGPRRRSPPPRVPEPDDAPAAPSLADLLADIAEERTRRRSERRDVPWTSPPPPGPRMSIPIAGCLVRIVLLVLFLIVLALAAVFVLLSA